MRRRWRCRAGASSGFRFLSTRDVVEIDVEVRDVLLTEIGEA
jgi:hypothetical protein